MTIFLDYEGGQECTDFLFIFSVAFSSSAPILTRDTSKYRLSTLHSCFKFFFFSIFRSCFQFKTKKSNFFLNRSE